MEVTDPVTGCSSSETYEVGADSRAVQTITFDLPESVFQDELPLALTASSDQNLEITYTIVAGVGEISEGQLISATPGELTISASNAGTAAIAAAASEAMLTIRGNYDLTGAVTGALNDQAIDGEVVLYDQQEQEVRRTSFTAGSYAISDVREGSYLLKIERASDFTTAAINTYYDGALTPPEASVITLTDDTTIDIALLTPTAGQSGSGQINGTVTQANGRSRIVIGRTLDGAPLENIAVYLIDRTSGAVVNQATTDETGRFAFDNVATGQYRFLIDAVGFEVADLGTDIDYDESEGTLEVSAEIGQNGLTLEVAVVSGSEELLSELRVFPNPVRHILHVQDPLNRIRSVQLHNLAGQLSHHFEANPLGQYDISALKDGIYIMRIEMTSSELVHSKIIIQH